MIYNLDWGLKEQNLVDEFKRFKRALPDPIQNKPKLRWGLELYLEAFYALDTERHHGMGLMRIPHSKIREYGLFSGFDEDQMRTLLEYITRMDNEFLKRLEAKNG